MCISASSLPSVVGAGGVRSSVGSGSVDFLAPSPGFRSPSSCSFLCSPSSFQAVCYSSFFASSFFCISVLCSFCFFGRSPSPFLLPSPFSCRPSRCFGSLSSFFSSSCIFFLFSFCSPSCRLFWLVGSSRLLFFSLVCLFCSLFPFSVNSSPFSGSSCFLWVLLLRLHLLSLLSLLSLRLLLLLLLRLLPLWCLQFLVPRLSF